jgi:hypothetical protein
MFWEREKEPFVALFLLLASPVRAPLMFPRRDGIVLRWGSRINPSLRTDGVPSDHVCQSAGEVLVPEPRVRWALAIMESYSQ